MRTVRTTGRKGRNTDDGYVLLYVVLVVVTLCILATSICTSALNNLKNQQNAAERMKHLYRAEGMIERFLSEAEKQTEALEGDNGYDAAEIAMEGALSGIEDVIKDHIATQLSGNPALGPMSFSLTAVPLGEEGFQRIFQLDLEAVSGSILITSQIEMVGEVSLGEVEIEEAGVTGKKTVYQVGDVSFEYKSYNVGSSSPEGGDS